MPEFSAVPGAALPAATYNLNVRNQVITTCTAATRPATPVEGQHIYETDTDLTLVWSGSAWVQVSMWGAWASWTPVVTQSVNVTVTNTRSRFARYGRTIHFTTSLTVTGAGTAANSVFISLPVNSATSDVMVGHGRIVDTSAAATWIGATYLSVGNTTMGIVNLTSGIYFGDTSGGFTAALAVGDVINISGTYEAA